MCSAELCAAGCRSVGGVDWFENGGTAHARHLRSGGGTCFLCLLHDVAAAGFTALSAAIGAEEVVQMLDA